MILIDTNVFLELALDQEKAADCASFLSEVAERKHTGNSYSLYNSCR